MALIKVTRRQLLWTAAGGAVAVGSGGLWLAIGKLRKRRWARAVQREQVFSPSVYLAIDSDDSVTVWLTRSEMGQGIATSLPMLIAEELDADWGRLKVEQAVLDGRYDFGSMLTAASSSVLSQWQELRRAGAAARSMLVDAACAEWDVARSDCRTESGKVFHVPSGRSLPYGALAARAATFQAPLRPALKAPADYRLIGRSVPRRDLAAKSTGRAQYGIDVRRDGMKRAALVRCPVAGGRLMDVDETQARRIPGVLEVLRLPSAVAVIAEDTWTAFVGAAELTPTWQIDDKLRTSSPELATQLQELAAHGGAIARSEGDALGTLSKLSKQRLSFDFQVPYLAHVTLEPMNCLAQIADGGCEIWAATQAPDTARGNAAKAAGVPVESVTVHTTMLGGGFGRRTIADEVEEAATLAAKLPYPVQVVWTREEDVRHDRYREIAYHRLSAALDEQGQLAAWHHRLVSPSIEGKQSREGAVDGIVTMGATDMPYDAKHLQVEWVAAPFPLPVGIWRGVGHSHNGFAIECFMDELAEAAQRDPVQWRLGLLTKHPRLAACLRKVAEMARWTEPRAAGHGLGVAVCACFGSYVAQVVEVLREADDFRVTRVWCAVDCGTVVNPDSVIAQVEGGVAFGLSAALFGNIHLSEGAVVESNFHDYRVLRMSEMPDVEVWIAPSAEPPGGVGELAVPPVAPAVANALHQVGLGRRRQLPLRAT
jgi:isoquinoline 1-oxidoreductase subunit beta